MEVTYISDLDSVGNLTGSALLLSVYNLSHIYVNAYDKFVWFSVLNVYIHTKPRNMKMDPNIWSIA